MHRGRKLPSKDYWGEENQIHFKSLSPFYVKKIRLLYDNIKLSL